MSDRVTRLAVLCAAALLSANGQWLNYPAHGTPRSRDGKPKLSARAPRASDGKPDLSGVWQTQSAPAGENERLFGASLNALGDDPRNFSKYFFDILVDFKAGESPLRPEVAESLRKNGARRETGPGALCLPMGLPHAELFNYAPFKIVQTARLIVVLYEADNTHRQIYMDGRSLPVDPQPSWLGYSVGHLEGDALAVDTAGFNDKSLLDAMGHPHSEDLRIQERFHRRDFGHFWT